MLLFYILLLWKITKEMKKFLIHLSNFGNIHNNSSHQGKRHSVVLTIYIWIDVHLISRFLNKAMQNYMYVHCI